MRFIIMGANLARVKAWGNHMFYAELARQHDVTFYTHGHPLYREVQGDVAEVFKRLGPFDAVFFGTGIAFQNMSEVEVLKLWRSDDYTPKYFKHHHNLFNLFGVDLVFVVSKKVVGWFNNECKRRKIDNMKAESLPFAVETRIYKDTGAKRKIDVMAVWSVTPWAYPDRLEIMRTINKMDDLNILAGSGIVIQRKYIHALRASKIFVNSNSIYGGVSMKFTEAMACGCFFLTDKIHESCQEENGFIDGEHLVVFDGIDDMKDKINYYLAHDKEREQIAQQGMDFVVKHHNTEIRVKQMVEVIKRYLDDRSKEIDVV